MKKIALVFTLFVSACSTPPSTENPVDIQASAMAFALTSVLGTQTANAPTTTNTHIPFTATSTYTPTIAFTPTISPTPLPLTSFGPLTFIEELRSSPNIHNGTYIKALAENADGAFTGLDKSPSNPFWLAPANYDALGIFVSTNKHPTADETYSNLKISKWVWIYGILQQTNTEYPLVSIIHTETIPENQMPRSSGVYKVNVDIAPGRWKSVSNATMIQDCYWARIASDGSIIENFFGYGGSTVYVRATDFAVEFNGCNVFAYLGQ